jgi:DNA topoisomerase-1
MRDDARPRRRRPRGTGEPRGDRRGARKGTPQSNGEDPAISAQIAGLRYVSDTTPGISRRVVGKGFRYFGGDDKPIKDADTLARIKALAIPPAWHDVWICPSPNGHIQAVGRDARNRKQYRYHPRWREVRDETKYGKMIAFAEALPEIRRKTEAHLMLAGMPREKVLATVVQLLEKTLIRVGNDEYAKNNESYGLTTMQDDHVEVKGSKVRFNFKGKSGIEHAIDLHDKRLAAIIDHSQDLPGEELFQYVGDDDQVHDIGSGDVNDYLRELTGEDFTAKDFRTWAGTVLATRALQELKEFYTRAQAKKNVIAAVESVAKRLGNTRAVCRKCYIHPTVIETYLQGSLMENLSKKAGEELSKKLGKLPPEEAAVLALLQKRLKLDSARSAA